jgi:hypothetical protein
MATKQAAGYSGTPLAKKLGIKDGDSVLAIDVPADYQKLLKPIPKDVSFVTKPDESIALAHVFVTRKAEMKKQLAALRKKLRPDAAVWVSWPKKAAKVETDITEDTIREIALPMGWVDIKVCAVSEIWSGLKLVVRKELR